LCRYGLAGRTPAPSQSVALLRAHARAMPCATRVEATKRPNLLFAEPWMLRCEGVCEVKEVAAHLFVLHPRQPRLKAGRVAAAGRHAGAGARRAPGSRAVASMPCCRSKSGQCGPKAAHRPTEVQLTARDTKPTRGSNPRGTSELLPLDQPGRTLWASWAKPTGPPSAQ
jgi:hypothetical protein